MAATYCQIPADDIADGIDSQPFSNVRRQTKALALIGGSCLMLAITMVVSASTSAHHNTNAVESASLVGWSHSVPSPVDRVTRSGMLGIGASSQILSKYGIGSSPLERLAILGIQANNLDNQVRDKSMKASMRETIVRAEMDAIKDMDSETKSKVAEVGESAKIVARDLVGATAPLGFWDPMGFSTKVGDGRLLFYREAELKHGRVCMLASLGIFVGEQFHPLFGGNIDVPSYVAFQQTPLQTFWYAVLAAIGLLEVPSLASFNWPDSPNTWSIKSDRVPGDLGFDPFGLKPKNPVQFKELQTKELNNGRLAMIAASGMILQEWATGKKLF